MVLDSKKRELEFHADRIKDASLGQLRSIISDPRLAPEEQFYLLQCLSKRYTDLGEFIHQELLAGALQGIERLRQAHQ